MAAIGLFVAALGLLGGTLTARQRASAASDAPQSTGPVFDVATVKPVNSPETTPRIDIQPGGRLTYSNVTLTRLVAMAYAVDARDVIGGPDWIDSARWEVMGRATTPLVDAGGSPAPAFLMIRHLLEERFQLKAHHEPRERPVYLLQLARPNGPAAGLRRTDVDCVAVLRDQASGKPRQAAPGDMPPCTVAVPPGHLRASAITMATLSKVLGTLVGRTVIDGTGLDGAFSMDLEFSPEFRPDFEPPAPGSARPPTDGVSLFAALQEQLGLRLVADRAQVDVLIVDHAERPTPD